MPLLRRQPFHREKAPPDLQPQEEVFYCKLTHEVFRDYEKFFERIILCNSLVWSCAITGRSGLTFQEAEESEEKALKQLASFPSYLQKPMLYLASKTQRRSVADINDDVFVFAKDRFFIGEMVEVLFGATKKTCKVVGVIPPGGSLPTSPVTNGDEGAGGDLMSAKKSMKKKIAMKPEAYQYVIQDPSKSSANTVKFKMISRKKGLYTRDKSKLFIKQNCELVDGVWRVKAAKMKKLNIHSISFEDIFSGPPPEFEFSEIKLKKPAKKPESKESSPAPPNKDFKKPSPGPSLTLEEIKALREQERISKEKEKEERLAQRTKEREEIRKKFLEEKEKVKLEKALEIEKKREERRVQAELWREWSKPRDDLDCDDLQVLPEPTPVKCRLPLEHFGCAVMIVEFVNCFSAIFDLRASFPKGFSLATLEEALLETDAGGLMADILLMMLTAIFSLQEEEEEEEAELSRQEKKKEAAIEMGCVSDMSVNQMIEQATTMSHLPLLLHGTTLRKLPLDNFTLTEILRLHILSSAAEANPGSAKFRWQQRGGYMPSDDAGLDFKRREPEIVSKLTVENIYDLPPSEKLKILNVLVDQFLTYAATRDSIEDNYDKLKQLRMDLKQLQWGEQRREREEAANRYKLRIEEKQKEREILEKRRILKLKQREEQLKKDEAVKAAADPKHVPMEINTNLPDIQVTEEELAELEASLPSQETREALQQEEDDTEADKKAEYMKKERDFMENIMNIQHGNAVYPIGRDRIYRRYWVFKSVPGVFVEDDELFVSEQALKPCSQNPNGSSFDLNNPLAAPPKLNMNMISNTNSKQAIEQSPQAENKDGSDKENDSMNASNLNTSALNDGNNSLNVSSMNTSLANASLNNSAVASANNSMITDISAINKDLARVSKEEPMIVISDDEDSKPPTLALEEKQEPAPFYNTPAIKQISERQKNQWAFYQTTEEIDILINSLNGRGFRERELKAALIEQKNKVIETVTEVDEDLLHIPDEDDDKNGDVMMSPKVRTKEWRRGRRNVTGTVKNDSAHEGLELNLREMILDLEERIHVGTLGYVRVNDRVKWRDAIENGGYISLSEDPTFTRDSPVKNGVSEDDKTDVDMPVEEENTNMVIARDMAKALVQIARGIEAKYLQKPLGDSDKTKQNKLKAAAAEALRKKKEKGEKDSSDESEDDDDDVQIKGSNKRTLMERWEDSCLLSSSLAQVFLHLSTLEKSVTWSKSLLHTRCRICRKKCDPDKILLCDICDRGHHMYCLKPELKHIPKADWFCPDCRPKEAKRSPRKERRPTFSEKQSDDEEEVEQETEDSSNEEAEDEASSEEDNDGVCGVCSMSGTLICCDSCPLSYHLTCANPPLKKVPRGKWLCQICNGTDVKAGKIKMNLVGKGKKNKKATKESPKSTPSSSKTSSRRGSPSDSPLTINPVKKRKRVESPEERPKMKKSAKSTSKLVVESKYDDVKHYTSSSRGSSKVQQLKLLEDVVLGLMEEDEAWPFLRPVVKKDAPDYYELIKIPMDFSTIKNKINKFNYIEPGDLILDVRQIFTNCVNYNKRTTQEFKAGSNMSKLFEKRLKNLEESALTNGPSGKRARTK